MFKNLGLRYRLWCGFLALIVLIFGLGLWALEGMNTLARITGSLHRHPFTVTNATLDIRSSVLEIQLVPWSSPIS
jgi:CHASE3 domain sensor protein